MSAPVPIKGTFDEEEKYEDKCVICLDNVPDAQMRPCSHSVVCRDCTRELMTRSQPCPICRKPISSFEVGGYCERLGERGVWPTSYKNLRQLASGEGSNEYFRNQFNRNEGPYLRWNEVRNCEDEAQRGANDDERMCCSSDETLRTF